MKEKNVVCYLVGTGDDAATAAGLAETLVRAVSADVSTGRDASGASGGEECEQRNESERGLHG